ncbi:MAG: TraB/GumN family protein [Bacteroidota bacterium]
MKQQISFYSKEPEVILFSKPKKTNKSSINSVFIFLFLWITFTINLFGETTARESSLLWKIEGDDIQTSYIFGTFHMISKNDFVLKDEVKNALKGSDVLILELDMDDPAMGKEMMKTVQMKDGESLKSLLDKKTYKAVDSMLRVTAGQKLKRMKTFKPFFVSSMLVPAFIDGTMVSYEVELMTLARGENKEVLGLETVEEQMAVFDSIPYQQQANELAEMVLENEKTHKDFQNMTKLYKAEDIEGLYKTIDDYHDSKKQIDWILHNRNINWQSRIPEMIRDQSAFIGVGAGHLGGEKGIVQLLRNAGYSVTPVK